jgi:apolipoprotein N-acyltransferase
MIALLCALASGTMFYLALGLHNVWWLSWFAPAPVLWLAYGGAPRRHIIACAFFSYAAGQLYMAEAYWGQLPLVLLVAQCAGFGALFARAAMIARRVRQSSWIALAAFPAYWTAIEYVVSLLSPHGTFGAMGYVLVAFPPAIQVASLFGLSAVTFLLCLAGNGLALITRGHWRAGLAGLALCLAALLFGYARLATPPGPTVRVAALSDWNARQASVRKLDLAASRRLADEYAAAAAAEADKGARLIVIPETALAFDPAWRGAVTEPLAALARARGVTLVMGTVGVKPWRNDALSFLPDGAVKDYDKRHLLSPFEDKYRPGRAPGLLGGAAAVAICKDLDFPATIRADAAAGAIRIMAVPANDFVKDDWLHARMAILRGVENGFAMVRSAFNGLETVSDAQGRVLASAKTTRPGLTAIRADVPLGRGATLYTRIGDVFAWACVALGLLGMLRRRQE